MRWCPGQYPHQVFADLPSLGDAFIQEAGQVKYLAATVMKS